MQKIIEHRFCMALRQTWETPIGRVILAFFGTLPPISAILQINSGQCCKISYVLKARSGVKI